MMLQAVFFDMGGTIDLYRYTRDFRISRAFLIRDCLAKAGIQLPWTDADIADALVKGMADYYAWNEQTNIELPPAEVWTRFILADLNINPDAIAPVAEDLAEINEAQLFIREMRPEIPSVLETIAGLGLKIGCISNTQSLHQVSNKLREYGIQNYFDPIVLSSEYGRRKPDPAIFYTGARLAGLPTSACIFVGDMINRDILGAKRAGYRLAVQIFHPYSPHEDEPRAVPDAILQNMNELIPILKRELERDRLAIQAPNSRKIKAIFFDAGDVLYFRPEKDKYLAQFLEEQSLEIQPELSDERERIKDLALSGRIGRHDYYDQVLKLYGVRDPEMISEGLEIMKQDHYNVEIIQGVPETILKLKEMGYILGIITDTTLPYSKKLDWFDQHGFGRVWDAVISSKELRVRKPSPLLYESAIRQAGVSPEETVFVGHSAAELAGASKVGMRTVAFNFEENAVADAYITSFSDLLSISLIH